MNLKEVFIKPEFGQWIELCNAKNFALDISADEYMHCNMDFSKFGFRRSPAYNKVEKIIKNPAKDATTIKWDDGTYTTVKRSPDDPEDDYAAFCSALAIKVYGSNSAVKRLMNKKTEILKKKVKKNEGSEQN